MAKFIITNKHFLSDKIGFIKALREVFDLSLKEAKEISDSFSFADGASGEEKSFGNLNLKNEKELSTYFLSKVVCNKDLENLVEEKFSDLINLLLQDGAYACAIAVIGCLKSYKNYEY